MTKSESITHLAAALAKAQAEMPVAVFDAQNKFLNNRYASLGAVIEASRPILAKHKLSLVQFPISEPARATDDTTNGTEGTNGKNEHGAQGTARPTEFVGVESILMHESGEFVAERIVIPLTEEKAKTKVQCAGSTLTYLRRYSWASILGMYSDEDSDGASGNLPVGSGAPPLGKSVLASLTAFNTAMAGKGTGSTLPVLPWVEVEALGEIEVKGKVETVAAYRVLRRKEHPGRARGIAGLTSPLVGRDRQLVQLCQAHTDLPTGGGRS